MPGQAPRYAPRPRPVPARSAWRTVWLEPRRTVHQVLRGDAAGFVILMAWLAGVLEVLQTQALRSSMRPHWGPFAVFIAVFMGPLVGFAYFETAGAVAKGVGRMLGGVGDVSDTRVALACGTMPELLALPFWAPVLAVYGLEMFTTARPPRTDGVLIFAALQILLWLWALGLRVVCLAEVHEFSIPRALLTVVLSWVAGIGLVIALVAVLAGMAGS